MRTLQFMVAMLVSMYAQAQLHDFGTDGFPTVPVARQHCVQHEDVAEGRSALYTSAVQANAPLRATGSPKIVVCLVQFPDAKFTVAENQEEQIKTFDTFFNGKGIGAGENPYSVSDYFRGMSNDIFSPEFVITGPVTMSRERSYYGNSNGSSRRMAFRNEALDSLSVRISGRVDELDTDDDGKVDGVILVFTGCGANVGDEEGMHPACWTGPVTRNGVTYATELVAPELLGLDKSSEGGENNAKLNGIGVYVHEISHMLGLPDFYDIDYEAPGMDYWSLMDYGEYFYNGYRPTPYTAYERHFMGWTSLVELSEPTYIEDMKALGDKGSAYIVYNDANRNEYYILENRTVNDPWSQSLCKLFGSGLMIYHVDFDPSAWSSNRVNTDVARQRMTIIPANGHFEICDNLLDDMDKYYSELRGHLWPLSAKESVLAYWGLAGNNALTDEERTEGDRIAPAARLHTPNTDGTYLMHKPITDIAFDAASQTVSFSFMGGAPTGVDDVHNGNTTLGDAVVDVYAMDGRKVFRGKESALSALPRGLYIIQDLMSGKSRKCFTGR